jgi:hypothetical protein
VGQAIFTQNENDNHEMSVSDFEVNQLIAEEIITQRLDIPATEQNIIQLALYITKLEDEQ